MKKVFMASILLLLLSSSLYSQFGIRGGLALSTWTGNDKSLPLSAITSSSGSGTIDPTTRTGFAGGISDKISLLLGLSIEPGVYYVQAGSVYEIPNTPMSYMGYTVALSGKATQKIDYIQIPVVIKYSFPTPIVSPYLEGGIAYNVLLSAKTKAEITVSFGGASQTSSNETDVKDSFNKSDVSIVLGAGAEISIIDVNARLVLGQTTLDKNSQAKVYNRTILLTAGLRF